MKKYDTLYAAGCSFTWHRPLRLEETWPYHLHRRMGIKNLINNGVGGGSNYKIFRRTEEYFRTNKNTSNTLAVIQLTNPLRFETYDDKFSHIKKYTEENWMDHIATHVGHNRKTLLGAADQLMKKNDDTPPHKKLAIQLLEARIPVWNETYEFYTYLQQIYSIDAIFKKYGVDVYYMNYHTLKYYSAQRTQILSDSFNWIGGNFDSGNIVSVGDFIDHNQPFGLRPNLYISETDHHPNSAGNNQLSKFIFEWIKNNPL